ncbi:MAG: hypothetical protein VYC19_09385, partial [Pseudomonadota bacterium]|nr:hypothetical protein [Pseudomonadota bacterium]
IRNDAYIAANATAVIELAKIIKEANATQQDVKLWTERLEDNFISIMKKKRYYTQMRFIGFHDNGREIVRVNQNDRGFERVKNDDLQYKGKEFYFAEADSLAYGEDYFSKITYNKEYGEVEPEKTPTLRSIVPVFDAQGNKFGFVVINVDYRRLLIAQYRDIKPEKNTYIINEYGDYMEYSPKKGLLDLVLGGADQNFSLQFLRTDEAELRDEYYVETTEDLIYSVKLNIAPDMDDNYLRAVLIIPRDEVFYQTNQVLYSIYVLSVLMVICTVIFSMIVSHFLTRSLCEMSKTLTRAIEQRDYKMDNLPVHQNDEVGDIARACDALSEEIHKRGLK